MSFLEITKGGILCTVGLFHEIDVPITRENLGKSEIQPRGALITVETKGLWPENNNMHVIHFFPEQ